MRNRAAAVNSFVGLFARIVIYLCSGIIKFFFSRYMLSELFGLEGLFSNIIGILSVTELGLGSTISYCLFEPIRNNNDRLVSAYMNFLRKIYAVVGMIIILLSFLILPFMNVIVKNTILDINYIRLCFIIYSIGIGLSYFFSYDRIIVFARQKNYIVSYIDAFTKILVSVIEIIAIIISSNYLVYISIISIGGLLSNFIVHEICKTRKYVLWGSYKLMDDEKKDLIDRCKNVVLVSILGKGVTSTDNIIISSLVGVMELTKNTGYSFITGALQMLILSALNGAGASIGDLIAENNKEKMQKVFEQYSFLYTFCASLCSVGFISLGTEVVKRWLGGNYIFEQDVVILLGLNLYLYLVQQPIWTFQSMGGLFKQYLPISFFQSIINITVSVIAAVKMGITGVFLGTFCCYFFSWFGFFLVLNKWLIDIDMKKYFAQQVIFIMVTAVMSVLNVSMIAVIDGNLVITILLAIIICLEYLLIYFILRKISLFHICTWYTDSLVKGGLNDIWKK